MRWVKHAENQRGKRRSPFRRCEELWNRPRMREAQRGRGEPMRAGMREPAAQSARCQRPPSVAWGESNGSAAPDSTVVREKSREFAPRAARCSGPANVANETLPREKATPRAGERVSSPDQSRGGASTASFRSRPVSTALLRVELREARTRFGWWSRGLDGERRFQEADEVAQV